jgi:hypothetical protein
MTREYLDIDARGVIHEAYRIEGITEKDCRTIFLDWAMFAPDSPSMAEQLQTFLDVYAPGNPDHPMNRVIREGLAKSSASTGRRGGRAGRFRG